MSLRLEFLLFQMIQLILELFCPHQEESRPRVSFLIGKTVMINLLSGLALPILVYVGGFRFSETLVLHLAFQDFCHHRQQ